MTICPYVKKDEDEAICVFYRVDSDYCERCLADRYGPGKYKAKESKRVKCTDPDNPKFGQYI